LETYRNANPIEHMFETQEQHTRIAPLKNNQWPTIKGRYSAGHLEEAATLKATANRCSIAAITRASVSGVVQR
jgi:hypothetical protein